MGKPGDSVDNALQVNLKNPLDKIKVTTEQGVDMTVDGRLLAKAAERIGANSHDILSIGGYLNAQGEFVPDYHSVRIEKRHADTEH